MSTSDWFETETSNVITHEKLLYPAKRPVDKRVTYKPKMKEEQYRGRLGGLVYDKPEKRLRGIFSSKGEVQVTMESRLRVHEKEETVKAESPRTIFKFCEPISYISTKEEEKRGMRFIDIEVKEPEESEEHIGLEKIEEKFQKYDMEFILASATGLPEIAISTFKKKALRKPITESLKLDITRGLTNDLMFRIQNKLLETRDIVKIMRVKKYIRESGKEDLVTIVDYIENEYFKEVYADFEELCSLVRGTTNEKECITIEEAEKRIKNYLDAVDDFEKNNDTKISSRVTKLNLQVFLNKIEIK